MTQERTYKHSTPEKFVAFLEEAANYFRKRDTRGEDAAFWANVYNAEACERIAAYIASPNPTPGAEVTREELADWFYVSWGGTLPRPKDSTADDDADALLSQFTIHRRPPSQDTTAGDES